MPDLPFSSEPRSPMRRRWLLGSFAAAVTAGCASGGRTDGTDEDAAGVLEKSARAHGLEAFATLRDINVAYAGHWHSLVKHLQPTLVDATFRGASEERLIPHEGRVSQFYQGTAGHKAVNRLRQGRDPGQIEVWFNGARTTSDDSRAAAALVSDGYSLFLLGPLLLLSNWRASVTVTSQRASTVRLYQDGKRRWCHSISLTLTPGLGLSREDQLILWIDADELLMRRASFTLNGLQSTRGAVAHVDTFSYVQVNGIQCPTRFHEHLERPLPLGVHDWALTGIDFNRGYAISDIIGAGPLGRAAPAASATDVPLVEKGP
jgi:hypothetical protein